jgi:hypothetical protein
MMWIQEGYDSNARGNKLKGARVDKEPTGMPGVGENTKWIMLTFDGTDFYGWDQNGRPILDYGTHGKFYVMDGPTWDGYHEFPPRVPWSKQSRRKSEWNGMGL